MLRVNDSVERFLRVPARLVEPAAIAVSDGRAKALRVRLPIHHKWIALLDGTIHGFVNYPPLSIAAVSIAEAVQVNHLLLLSEEAKLKGPDNCIPQAELLRPREHFLRKLPDIRPSEEGNFGHLKVGVNHRCRTAAVKLESFEARCNLLFCYMIAHHRPAALAPWCLIAKCSIAICSTVVVDGLERVFLWAAVQQGVGIQPHHILKATLMRNVENVREPESNHGPVIS